MKRIPGRQLLPLLAVCVVVNSGQARGDTTGTAEVEEIRAILDGLNESYTDTRNTVELLRKFKLSGYIQAQFRSTSLQRTSAPFSGGDFPAQASSMFQIRRGRLKLTYDNVLTQGVLQIDVTQSGVLLRDAYLWATEPWLQAFGIQAGGFDRPFGYELGLSSGWRESPERARATQTLFPGERDIGVKLFFAPQLGSLSFLKAELGIFNGPGVNSPEYDDFKDLIGRVGVQIPFEEAGAAVDVGVSGYLGRVRNDTRFLWTHGEPVPGVKGFVVDSAGANTGEGVPRRYVGTDVQAYYDVPVIGGLVVRAEVVLGTQPGASDVVKDAGGTVLPYGQNLRNISPVTQPTGPIYRRDFLAWYVNLVQNLGSRVQVVLKYDVLDPNTGVGAAEFAPGVQLSPADVRFATFGMGGLVHWDENIRLTVYYEFVRNEELPAEVAADAALGPFVEDRKDDVLTVRLQYRF